MLTFVTSEYVATESRYVDSNLSTTHWRHTPSSIRMPCYSQLLEVYAWQRSYSKNIMNVVTKCTARRLCHFFYTIWSRASRLVFRNFKAARVVCRSRLKSGSQIRLSSHRCPRNIGRQYLTYRHNLRKKTQKEELTCTPQGHIYCPLTIICYRKPPTLYPNDFLSCQYPFSLRLIFA
jgi:hypothetical protein